MKMVCITPVSIVQTLQRKPGGGETENLADMEMKEDTNVPVDNLGVILMRKLLVIFLWRPDSRCFFFLFLFLSWLSSFLSSAASVAAGKRVLQRTTFTLSHPNIIILHQLLMDQGDRGG